MFRLKSSSIFSSRSAGQNSSLASFPQCTPDFIYFIRLCNFNYLDFYQEGGGERIPAKMFLPQRPKYCDIRCCISDPSSIGLIPSLLVYRYVSQYSPVPEYHTMLSIFFCGPPTSDSNMLSLPEHKYFFFWYDKKTFIFGYPIIKPKNSFAANNNFALLTVLRSYFRGIQSDNGHFCPFHLLLVNSAYKY